MLGGDSESSSCATPRRLVETEDEVVSLFGDAGNLPRSETPSTGVSASVTAEEASSEGDVAGARRTSASSQDMCEEDEEEEEEEEGEREGIESNDSGMVQNFSGWIDDLWGFTLRAFFLLLVLWLYFCTLVICAVGIYASVYYIFGRSSGATELPLHFDYSGLAPPASLHYALPEDMVNSA